MVDPTDPRQLTSIEARVLGALIEKQLTTPDAYPLTLKALIAACNQTSNRDPVVSYDAREVEATVLALKGKHLTRVVHPGSGERATRYRHVADETYDLDEAGRALLGALLLRGPQTTNELRTRTERLHAFASSADVEAALAGLTTREPPLVTHVDRRPGQKEGRWIQLVELGSAERAASAPAPTPSGPTRAGGRLDELEERVAVLEGRLTDLVTQLGDLVTMPHPEPTDGPSTPDERSPHHGS